MPSSLSLSKAIDFPDHVYCARCLGELFVLEAMKQPLASHEVRAKTIRKLKRNKCSWLEVGPRDSDWPWEEFLEDLHRCGLIAVRRKKNQDRGGPIGAAIQRDDSLLLTHDGHDRLADLRHTAKKKHYLVCVHR